MSGFSRSAQTHRRANDSLVGRFVAGLAGPTADSGNDPVWMGRSLLVLLGALTVASAVFLHPDAPAWRSLALVSGAMIVALVASFVVPWARLPRYALLAYPMIALAALAFLGLGRHGLFAPLSGFSVLCYGYVGLTQRPRTSPALVPVASLALVSAYGQLSADITIRLLIALTVQVILAEVLAGFVARQAELSDALESAAYNDPLTGIPNRRDLDSHLMAAGPGTTVVICDLDQFKKLNDTQGHAAGDHVLADFGGLLRAALREGDYFARFGGEEFVLLLPDTTPEIARTVLRRLRDRWQVLQPDVTFSSGLAACADDRTPSETLSAADGALYRAKDCGRNTDRWENGVVEAVEAVDAVGQPVPNG